jgi:hypothetical protein
MSQPSAELFAKPCVKCGAVDRKPDGNCRPCAKRTTEAWRKANPHKVRGSSTKWRNANPEANARAQRVLQLKQYSVTLEEYNRMLAEQGGLCAISKRPETKMRNGKVVALSVDHNHKTGKVRKLLSDKINRGLAYFDEDPALLRAAADYLEENA